MLIVLKSLL